jgi:hypothetical protein
MLVVNVDGDGQNELITGHAHGYGLWWSERQARWYLAPPPHRPLQTLNITTCQWADI